MAGKSFIKGALILSLAGIIGKLLGALYRIPFSRIVGPEAMAIYSLGYPLYTVLLALSTAGIPLAVSKLIAECEERQEYETGRRIFKLALLVLAIIGVVAAVLLFTFADFIATNILLDTRAGICLKAIAPAMVFTCLMAVFRGYFQGLQQMVPTAVSQIIEQFVRVGTIFIALFVLMPYGLEIVVGGASLGAATGGMAAFAFLVCAMLYYRRRHPQKQGRPEALARSNGQVIRQVLYLAIPISIGALVLPLMQSIDAVMVVGRLEAGGFSHQLALVNYGYLSAYAGTVINLPFLVTTALSASLVPNIAEALAAGRRDDVRTTYRSAMLLAIIVVLPAAVGLMTLASPICQLLYGEWNAGVALLWAAPTVLVVGLYQTSSGTLQGMGRIMVPMQALLIGAGIKIVLAYVLTPIPALGIRGAALSTVVGFAVAAFYNIYHVSKEISWQWFDLPQHLLRPLVSVAAMGIVVTLVYRALNVLSGSNGLATLAAIAIGGVSYFVVLLAIGGIRVEDIRKMPKVGERAANLLIKLHLARD